MTYKLLTRMVEYASDANPDKKWSSTFVGVLPTDSRPKPEIGAMRSAMLPKYEFMCAAIDALRAIDLIDTLEQIEAIESGKATDGSTGLDAYAAMFDKNKAWFWCEFGPTGEEVEGGQVSLAQFKLAVQTYLRFLQDPERKPIEVVFPDSTAAEGQVFQSHTPAHSHDDQPALRSRMMNRSL